MKEIKAIIGAYDKAVSEGKQTALATVVYVEGSSYRRPGARMLVTEDGMLTGAISGGCLEGDALRKALLVMTEKRTRLVTYDTNDEDDATLGMGLGCNGIIQVLIEPLDPSGTHNPVQLLKAAAAKRQQSVLVTLFSMQDRKSKQPGTCFLLNEDGTLVDNLTEDKQIWVAEAKQVLADQHSSFKNHVSASGDLTGFIEFIKPAVSLVVAGAGNDVMPLADMATVLGWETTVVDGRANYAKAERFPSACEVIVSKPEELLRQIIIDDQTVFTLMTHNYNYDKALLQELLRRNAVYIGLLGPWKKRDRLISELREEGMVLTEEQLSAVHGPVGLDIGAETPEEIALSVIAEIQAVLSGKQGKQLKHGGDTIHNRAATTIERISNTSNQQ